jgi:Ca2+-transporting ATPase
MTITVLETMPVGLTAQEAQEKLRQYGPNALPETKSRSFVLIFLRQFLSPLIYILLIAALVSVFLSDVTDALFIATVLLVNGIIGAVQEYSAGRAAAALKAAQPELQRGVTKGILHKNTVARKISRLAKRVKALA